MYVKVAISNEIKNNFDLWKIIEGKTVQDNGLQWSNL